MIVLSSQTSFFNAELEFFMKNSAIVYHLKNRIMLAC
jgi:hypothetical protein